MSSPVSFRTAEEVAAALSSDQLVPPSAPRTLGAGSTAALRGSMARFSSGLLHAQRRAEVVALLASLDPGVASRFASARTAAKLHGASIDLVADLAFRVPTEALLYALSKVIGSIGPTSSTIDQTLADLGLMVASIGRGAEAAQETDDAVDRLMALFSTHSAGATVVLSALYQNHDATAALLIETFDTKRHGGPQRAAVVRTLRVAVTDVVVADRQVPEGAEVVLDLAESGFQFGFGSHQCPGRQLAESIVDGIMQAIGSSGYTLDRDGVVLSDPGRPILIPLQPS